MITYIYIDRSGHKKARPVKNRKALMALRNSSSNLRNLQSYREGHKEAKANLLQLAYNARPVNGVLAGCKHYSSTFFHDIDCYNRDQAEQYKSQILSKKEEIGLLMLERSPSGGWHLVCRRERGKTILENQVRVATILQIEMDTNAKDLQRVVYSTSGSEEDLPYLDDAIFEEPMTVEESAAEYQVLKDREKQRLEEIPPEAKKANKHYKPWENTMKTTVGNQTSTIDSPDSYPSSFEGVPYKDIIAEWWRMHGGEPSEGERNTSVHQLAVHLRTICDNKADWLLQILPNYGMDAREMKSIVDSATKDVAKGKTREIRAVLKALGVENKTAQLKEDNIARWLWEWGEQIEALSKDYPLLKDICKGLKKNQYPAAMFVAGGLLMTLMTRCTYRFYHRPEELRRLNNSTLIIGDPASGKSFATRLFKLIASPIVAADKIGKDAINAYREQMRTKGANKEKPKKPKVVVRIHPARTSNAQFIQDMVNAIEEVDGEPMQLHMLTFDTELDNTLSLQKGGAYIDKQSLQLKAFHNEEDGQAYSNVDSIFQEFYVIWNFIYTGTPLALKRMVNEQNFGSGLATRLTCIPLPATNFEMMDRESHADFESDARLKEWAEKLDRMKGELTVQKIVDELYDWTARRMMDAKDNESLADEMLLKRCAYHGLNFSAPFIVMRHWDKMRQDGQYWCGEFETDEVDWRLAELITNIQFACQRHYFGAMAEAYFDNKMKDASVNVQRRQRTYEAFERLPEQFSVEDVMRCFQLNSEGSARVRTKRLIEDHLAEKVGEIKEGKNYKSVYRKTGVVML